MCSNSDVGCHEDPAASGKGLMDLRSKLVAGFPAAVFRVGQVPGSEEWQGEGVSWNKHELILFIIASSLYLKDLTCDLEQIDWVDRPKPPQSKISTARTASRALSASETGLLS
ncbi:hypothetical protein F5Y13DRAFT_189759 [Hypoxylon sp. FL1857]|nr:hypothetical protein F5Y13DRAFT_189759 [Hypoxylon sp. FL1857]